ncbi:30S ribosomal protein S8 [Candidatus Kaiserbacteria bacterium RIFCSPHIGHO2_02_FULL_55_20]|uniref:Small ribosomal subunit protein uS8 n=1 Tax=Candidatus Kaiserbacteria bacterium RIFCSPHIGHO2_02_FULL_55_20 TaxID=1798497 RepID=A0A1F6DX25_9BACT|nr:MAG: 30S ribosomal protein S8 [Candidatus Kaiserbacteria bacterium RIFCSPHIGHO2_01_FULL_55_37]OGG65968.1 MAG: 30S ribosomal protein S8 [Candidatus Kaiserbacteria bacterium RIFCSPHIGHO2_02_FULL_55_20]
MVNDTIGDFIVRLTNAGAIKKATVSIPYSAFKMAVAEKLKDMGYVQDIEKKGKKVRKTLDVTLKYNEAGEHIIRGVKRVSKPGRRLYKSTREIMPVRYGHGALVLSTPKGVLSDKEARKQNVGGEALFEIW